MSRYIDAEKINYHYLFGFKEFATKEQIDEIPTADVAPVVHAHWIDSPNISECVVCSNCSSDNLSAQVVAPPPAHYKFCPNCGAKMGEDGDNE